MALIAGTGGHSWWETPWQHLMLLSLPLLPWPMADSPQDCEDPNPLIRALAVRTMGCIRVDKITEYLCEPLRKCLKDEDPYVRKTAAVCVAKLHDINAQLVEDQGFLDTLKDLISDSNPMVSRCHPPCQFLYSLGCLGTPWRDPPPGTLAPGSPSLAGKANCSPPYSGLGTIFGVS